MVVSDGEIHYPNVRKADLFIALSQVALDTYIADLREGGILLFDPNSVKNVPDRDKYRVYEVPTMEIAHDIGGVRFQNSVALGALYRLIAHMIKEILAKPADEKTLRDARSLVSDLCQRFPIYEFLGGLDG